MARNFGEQQRFAGLPARSPILSQLSVVIPCHNEASSLPTLIAAIPQGIGEIIVVDNNSTDRTGEIAADLGARVLHEPMLGYGAALRRGLANARGSLLAVLDGDNQYPPEAIAAMVDFLVAHELDFVCASRFPLDDKQAMGPTRRLGNRGLTIFANALFGLPLSDSQSGMWLFRKPVLQEILPQAGGMAFSQELKIRAATAPKLRFAEYHITYRPRIGRSKLMPLRHGLELIASLFRLRFTL